MLGILCEKPSAARNFATALGGKSGNFNGEDYVIVAARGHLYEFIQPHEMVPEAKSAEYKRWSLATLPWNEKDLSWTRKRKTGDGIPAVIKEIKDTLSQCDEIAIATDDDPTGEGELLAWEILDDLKLRPRKWSRFYFPDEAPASIKKAFKERKPIQSMVSDLDYLKAFYRSQWDFMSMQFTRIASCLTGVKLRQGRLKSYMVVVVGDQLKLVREYKKIPFYQWKFKDENNIIYTNPEEDKFPSKDQIQPGKYHASPVTVDSTDQKTQAPPTLPDISAISAALAPKGVKASEVLSVYQKMYEDQVVSYPRTEDKVITPEQFNELFPHIDKIARAVGVDPSLLTHKQPRTTHVKTGGAHGANRPGLRIPPNMEALEGKYGKTAVLIYEILAKAFLAMFCEDYVYIQQKGHVTNYPAFKGIANKPVSMGYKVIYNDDDFDENEDQDFDALLGKNAEPFVHEGFPPKPLNPTQKWLMKLLIKQNIGTGATRTSTYAEVSNARSESSLLKDTKGKITLTYPGEVSYAILPGTHIGSLNITEQVHAEMNAIMKGQATSESLLPKIKQLVLDDIETMKANLPNVIKAFPDLDSVKVPKEKMTGIFVPTGKEITFVIEFSGHKFTQNEIMELLTGKEITFQAISKTTGKEFPAKGSLKEQEYKGKRYWGFALTQRENTPCPEDKVEGLYKSKKLIRFKKEWSGHTFTTEEKEALLKGNEIEFEAISSKSGNSFPAKGKLAEQSYNGSKFWGFKPEFEKK